MIDKFVLLTPLIILPIVLLFAFVGCGFHTHGVGITQATLIIHPDVFGTRNIVSFTVTFDLKSSSSFYSNQVSKTVTSWTKTDSQEQVSLAWSQDPTNDNGPFTASCAVMLVDNNDYHSPVTPVQEANLTSDNLNAVFELKPDDSNSFADFTLVNAS
jgi:hypothetical protein